MAKSPRLSSLSHLAALVLLSGAAFAQAPASPSDVPLIRAETKLVVVDVTVQDKQGRPVHNLKREDFALTEDKQPQAIRSFEEFAAQANAPSGPQLPPMPPGTFTDYTPTPSLGPLNILLLDTLNTPMADQSYVRYELQQYVKKAKPGTRIAIFGLARRLYLLQGFSSDPTLLKDAVEHKLVPRASSLLDDAQGSGVEADAPSASAAEAIAASPDSSSPQVASVVSSMQQFEAEQNSFQTQLRTQYTLDAFNALAHYLSAFPGRKNLIWFSGSFPIDILPDPALENGFAVMENNDAEFRETTAMLSRAQVAVYPVDARGLADLPMASASSRKSDPFGKASASALQSQASEHMTMAQLAENTGGRAFYDTNDLAASVQDAIESGSNYYTLSYHPTNQGRSSTYREIRITLNGNLKNAGYRLLYRRGYYTDEKANAADAATHSSPANAASESSADRYARAAMAHGAPAPADILFKARVLPVGTAPEQILATNNMPDPAHPIKPPFRRFAVDVAAVPEDFSLTLGKDGYYTGAIEFSVLLYDNDGTLLNAIGKKIQLHLTQDSYRQFLSGVNGHFEISLPPHGGNDFLRIGIHDLASNRFGVVEVPVASVERLTPLPAAAPH